MSKTELWKKHRWKKSVILKERSHFIQWSNQKVMVKSIFYPSKAPTHRNKFMQTRHLKWECHQMYHLLKNSYLGLWLCKSVTKASRHCYVCVPRGSGFMPFLQNLAFFLHGTGLVGTKDRRLKESYKHYRPIQKTTETR